MSDEEALGSNLAQLRDLVRRFGWLYRLRPQVVAEPLYRLVGPRGGRAIIEVSGARLYVDPFSTSGRCMVDGEEYEPDLVTLIRTRLPVSGVFFDVGANEGVFSAIAGNVAGPGGTIIAIEPQTRLRDILEINIALNCRGSWRIFYNAIGERDGDVLNLSLGPMSRNGGSSLVHSYRWSGKKEAVLTRSIDSIVEELGSPVIDLMKIDVEGFEPEVIRSAAQTLAARRIRTLAVDVHSSILTSRGIDPHETDARIRNCGYIHERGDVGGGYNVYSAQ